MLTADGTLESWEEFREVDYLGLVQESVGAIQPGFQNHPLSSLLSTDAIASMGGLPPTLLQVSSGPSLDLIES